MLSWNIWQSRRICRHTANYIASVPSHIRRSKFGLKPDKRLDRNKIVGKMQFDRKHNPVVPMPMVLNINAPFSIHRAPHKTRPVASGTIVAGRYVLFAVIMISCIICVTICRCIICNLFNSARCIMAPSIVVRRARITRVIIIVNRLTKKLQVGTSVIAVEKRKPISRRTSNPYLKVAQIRMLHINGNGLNVVCTLY